MTNVAVNSFLDLVRRSRLVSEDQLGEFIQKESARHGGQLPESKNELSAALIKQGLITQWQADKLLDGKHKGFVLGKYKLLDLLDKGGMSQVYLAEHTLMDRKVAIKVLPHSRVEDSTYLQRFQTEARAAAKLDDVNIVRAYDIDQDGNTHYLVMEYVDGRDLHQLVKEIGPLDYNTAANYIAQISCGLQHAHMMGLVHRDIKPANCLVNRSGTVKLLDMGLARLVGDEASLTLDNNENVLGTADYLAPEQALNSHGADLRADIYSLGCTLYFLLTGHPPFPEGTIPERLLKHQVEMPPSIFNDRPETPPTLVNICNRMMAKKPQDRYQTAGEVAEKLSEWLADRGVTSPRLPAKDKKSSGNVESDVFRRFAASIERSGPKSDADGSGKVTSETGSSASGILSGIDDAEIGLAPLEDEQEDRNQSKSKSGRHSIHSGKSKGTKLDSHDPGDTTPTVQASSDTLTEEGSSKSLIEEQLDAGRIGRDKMPKPKLSVSPDDPDDFNPLYPPDYVPPRDGLSRWGIAGIAAGAIALLLLTYWLVSLL
jgi:eukaryotic-like serine/threonine-protein kinase